jgi:DcuC family C4-dicarboxylate transporter
MRAARLSSVTIGASILLGASIGGELLNPGAPELNTVGKRLGISPTEVVPSVVPLIFPHLAIATAIFWIMRLRAERKVQTTEGPSNSNDVKPADDKAFRVNIVRALVPLLPLALLFMAGPPLHLVDIPERWVVTKSSEPLGQLTGGAAIVLDKKDPKFDTRLIGLAMLVGVVAAALSNPRVVRGVPKAFFEGAGYAFTEVVSLIVIASCFGKGIEIVGVAKLIGDGIQQVPGILLPVAAFVPLAFGALSGSGMASTQSLYGFFVEPAEALGVNPKEVGAIVSIGAAAGRTMSPVAAVALMSARLTGTNPFELVRRVAPPLLISMAIVITLRILRLV